MKRVMPGIAEPAEAAGVGAGVGVVPHVAVAVVALQVARILDEGVGAC